MNLNQQAGSYFQQEHDKAVDNFIEESRFAKVVRTEHGDAILINGDVIEVKCSQQEFIVDALVRALRRTGGKLEIASSTDAK